MDTGFNLKIMEPVGREIYSCLFQSDEPAEYRTCYVRLLAHKTQLFRRVGRTYTPWKMHISGLASLVHIEQWSDNVSVEDSLCNAIGDAGGVIRSTSLVKMSPEVGDIEAVRHIIDECIEGVLEVFSWNEQDEQDAIRSACAKAKERLMRELKDAVRE